MPRRKRAQEVKRALRRIDAEVVRVEAAIKEQEALIAASTDPLDDMFWRDREDLGPCYPDDDCYFYCPHDPLREAREEIAAYHASDDRLK